MTPARDDDRKRVWLASTVGLAILSCYGTSLVLALLAASGIAIAIHEGLWATVIGLFTIAAFVATLSGYRRHGLVGPAIVAGAGAALVLWALFVSYDWRVELAGFTGLALAAVWQWRLAAHQDKGE